MVNKAAIKLMKDGYPVYDRRNNCFWVWRGDHWEVLDPTPDSPGEAIKRALQSKEGDSGTQPNAASV